MPRRGSESGARRRSHDARWTALSRRRRRFRLRRYRSRRRTCRTSFRSRSRVDSALLSGRARVVRIHHVAENSLLLGSRASIARVTPEELCSLYAERVCRFAAVVAGRECDPEDIAQDALLKAITKLYRFDLERGSMEGWLWRIVANTAKDATRKARLRALLADRLRHRQPAVVDLE